MGYAVLGGKGSWGSRFAGLGKGGFAGEDIAVREDRVGYFFILERLEIENDGRGIGNWGNCEVRGTDCMDSPIGEMSAARRQAGSQGLLGDSYIAYAR